MLVLVPHLPFFTGRVLLLWFTFSCFLLERIRERQLCSSYCRLLLISSIFSSVLFDRLMNGSRPLWVQSKDVLQEFLLFPYQVWYDVVDYSHHGVYSLLLLGLCSAVFSVQGLQCACFTARRSYPLRSV